MAGSLTVEEPAEADCQIFLTATGRHQAAPVVSLPYPVPASSAGDHALTSHKLASGLDHVPHNGPWQGGRRGKPNARFAQQLVSCWCKICILPAQAASQSCPSGRISQPEAWSFRPRHCWVFDSLQQICRYLAEPFSFLPSATETVAILDMKDEQQTIPTSWKSLLARILPRGRSRHGAAFSSRLV